MRVDIHGKDSAGVTREILVGTDGSIMATIVGGSLSLTSFTGADTVNNLLVVEERYQGLNVTTSTQIKGGPGFVHSISFSQTGSTTPTAGVLTVYDSLAASGTIKFQQYFAASVLLPLSIILDEVFTTGIFVSYVTVAGISTNVSYR